MGSRSLRSTRPGRARSGESCSRPSRSSAVRPSAGRPRGWRCVHAINTEGEMRSTGRAARSKRLWQAANGARGYRVGHGVRCWAIGCPLVRTTGRPVHRRSAREECVAWAARLMLRARAAQGIGSQSHGRRGVTASWSDSERRTLSERVMRSKDGAHRGEAEASNSPTADRTSVFRRRDNILSPGYSVSF